MVVSGLKLSMRAVWKQPLWAPLQRSQHAQWQLNHILQVLCKALPSLLQDSSGYCNCYFGCEAQRYSGAQSSPGHGPRSRSWLWKQNPALDFQNTPKFAEQYRPKQKTLPKPWYWPCLSVPIEHAAVFHYRCEHEMECFAVQNVCSVYFCHPLICEKREILKSPGKSSGMKKQLWC